MSTLHLISDNVYFLLGFNGMHSVTFSRFSNLNTIYSNGKVNDKAMSEILMTDEDIVIVNIACWKTRRAILTSLSSIKKRVLIMANFVPSEGNLYPFLINKNVTYSCLLQKASSLRHKKIELKMVKKDISILFLHESGVDTRQVSNLLGKGSKEISFSRRRIIERFGLSGNRWVNIFLCCDIIVMFNSHT